MAGSGPNSIARLVAACPASSQAGPVDLSTQSTTPEIWPALHSRLRWLNSRCKKVGRYAGAPPRAPRRPVDKNPDARPNLASPTSPPRPGLVGAERLGRPYVVDGVQHLGHH